MIYKSLEIYIYTIILRFRSIYQFASIEDVLKIYINRFDKSLINDLETLIKWFCMPEFKNILNKFKIFINDL